MSRNKNHYEVLGVDLAAPEDEIKKAYKRLARVYHPDLNPKRPRTSEDRFKRLQQAYDVLSDPVSRRQYDQSLGYSPPAPQPSPPPWSPPGGSPLGYTKYQSGSWTVHVYSNDPKGKSWFRGIHWRRKLAVILWALCLMGSFLPTSYSVVFSLDQFYVVPFAARLLWISIPLVMVWVGTWISDAGGGLDMEFGTVIKEGVGILLEGIAWVYFARLIGLTVIGPLILLVS